MTRKEMQDRVVDLMVAIENGAFSAKELTLTKAVLRRVTEGIDELLDEVDKAALAKGTEETQ
jgi:hypothetical protein